MTRIAINGFGRIGRCVVRLLDGHPELELVAVNDLMPPKTLVHLLRYDSVHGRFEKAQEKDGDLLLGGKAIKIIAERDPAKLPWRELGVDIVLECTGLFRDRDKAGMHLSAGARKVIISAPAKGEDGTFVMGVNHNAYDNKKHHVVSNASCTTNCLAPVAKVLHDEYRIVNATMTTIHSYTNDQQILDLPHKDLRRARAGALSMIPTTTGAARAIALVIPDLKGKIDGMAIRVPTPNVSVVDLVAQVEKVPGNPEEINQKLRAAAQGPLKGILETTDEPLVSVK
ncbi:MAG: type I glyceraldehyde-3-phosphate dehydrogenase [Polyangia bacterium]|jgi:glyceraldehyde 3-phosphate dehydrogenase|nr:type I glyceraldehyde-3-phosphate dehydrogenase [Polyangia bacterium]